MSKVTLLSSTFVSKDPLWSFAVHPSLPYLLCCGSGSPSPFCSLYKVHSDGSIELYQRLVDHHDRTVRTACFGCDGALATGSFDGTVCVWDFDKGSERYSFKERLQGQENEVKCVSFSPCGTLLASASRDKSVWVWDVLDSEVIAVLSVHEGDVKAVAWGGDNELVSCSYDGFVCVFKEDDEGDFELCQKIRGYEGKLEGEMRIAFVFLCLLICYMYVCMYVRMYVCTYVCVCMYVCMLPLRWIL